MRYLNGSFLETRDEELFRSNFLRSDNYLTINPIVRGLWYSIFEPSASQSEKIDRALCARTMFDALSKMNFDELESVWNKNYYNCNPYGKAAINLGEMKHKIPPGEHLVVPIMVSGIMPAAFVNSYLLSRDRSEGFALVGYSSGLYKDHLFSDGTKVSGKFNISDPDLCILYGNRDKSVIVVDDSSVTKNTIDTVVTGLKTMGFERIKKVIWYPSHKI